MSISDCNTRNASTMDSPKQSLVSSESPCTSVPTNGTRPNPTCRLQDPFCPFQGSDHVLDGLRDVCVLWDKSCCGKSALAPQYYYSNSLSVVISNNCFKDFSAECSKSNPPGRRSAFDELKNWMRGPQCFASNPQVEEYSVRHFNAFSAFPFEF